MKFIDEYGFMDFTSSQVFSSTALLAEHTSLPVNFLANQKFSGSSANKFGVNFRDVRVFKTHGRAYFLPCLRPEFVSLMHNTEQKTVMM
jgi:hypothetical protein